MKPVEATWEGRGVRRGGINRQLRNVCLIFRVLRLVAEALALHPTWMRLHPVPAS